MIHISGRAYALIHENRNGWNIEAFRERYSEVLERYDYVVGDWGYNQLRLRGFFRDNHPKATRDTIISSIADYINEYCNFGCAYFVLEKQPGGVKQGEDGEISEDGAIEVIELPDSAEEAFLTASRTIAAAKAADAPASENQHVKFMPRHERDLRREQQRNSRKETTKETDKPESPRENHRKPSGKGDHGARQGQQGGGRGQQHDRQDRGERSEKQHRGGERQDRGGERQERGGERQDRGGERQDRGGERQDRGGERQDRGGGERQERSERNRNKQRHFNQKAPVAAAAEPGQQQQHQHQQHQQNRNKDAAPKQS